MMFSHAVVSTILTVKIGGGMAETERVRDSLMQDPGECVNKGRFGRTAEQEKAC
jgi:hypothetical protein